MSMRRLWLLGVIAALALPGGVATLQAQDDEPATMVVTAEGIVDPEADTYRRDKGLMIDALREDARRQAIEKAVGTMVETSTLVQNYVLLQDRVFTRSRGLIKRIIKESEPWLGGDGFMHMMIRAEVYIGSIRDTLREMTRAERIALIKEYGNVTISVAITIRNAERGPNEFPERSPIAENIFKDRMSRFGYRVWSEEVANQLKVETMRRAAVDNSAETTVSVAQQKAANFSVVGEAKFKKVQVDFNEANMTVTKYVLTSLTVKCVDNNTGEEIYFNNKVPRNRSWADEDRAIEDIGTIVADEFSREFFENHLMNPSRTYQVQVTGLPNYDAGVIFKREMIGLRPVLNVDFRNYDANGLSRFEVEFAGQRNQLLDMLNNTIIKPLNRILGEEAFSLMSAQGDVVRVAFQSSTKWEDVLSRFDTRPPASLVNAPPERIKAVATSPTAMTRIAELNPGGVKTLAAEGSSTARQAIQAVKDF
jgi:hypothetical protein